MWFITICWYKICLYMKYDYYLFLTLFIYLLGSICIRSKSNPIWHVLYTRPCIPLEVLNQVIWNKSQSILIILTWFGYRYDQRRVSLNRIWIMWYSLCYIFVYNMKIYYWNIVNFSRCEYLKMFQYKIVIII